MGRESSEGEGGSLALENIDDIVPLGAGPDQVPRGSTPRRRSGFTCNDNVGGQSRRVLTIYFPLLQLSDSPTDASFSVLVGDERLDIVAPTSFDFQVRGLGSRALVSLLRCTMPPTTLLDTDVTCSDS